MTQTQARSANTRNARLSRAEAQEFLHTEAALLDAGRHDQWLELFAQDGVFWVPCNELDNDPARCVSIIYDTREALELRVRRLQIGRTVQEITSRTLHLISNVTVEPPGEDPTLVAVRAGLALYEVHARRNAWSNSQYLWIGVSRGSLLTSLIVGAFDEFAVLESGAGTDESDQVWGVDRAPALLS